jgi:hypothetical protein
LFERLKYAALRAAAPYRLYAVRPAPDMSWKSVIDATAGDYIELKAA